MGDGVGRAEPEETKENQSLLLWDFRFIREDNFNHMACEGYNGSALKEYSTAPGRGGSRGRVIRESFLEEATLKQSLNSRKLSGSHQARGSRGKEENFLSPA